MASGTDDASSANNAVLAVRSCAKYRDNASVRVFDFHDSSGIAWTTWLLQNAWFRSALVSRAFLSRGLPSR